MMSFYASDKMPQEDRESQDEKNSDILEGSTIFDKVQTKGQHSRDDNAKSPLPLGSFVRPGEPLLKSLQSNPDEGPYAPTGYQPPPRSYSPPQGLYAAGPYSPPPARPRRASYPPPHFHSPPPEPPPRASYPEPPESSRRPMLSRPWHQIQENRRETPSPPSSPRPHGRARTGNPKVEVWSILRSDIFSTLTSKENPYKPKTASLNIAAAQRLVLAQSQFDIAEKVATLYNANITSNLLPAETMENLRMDIQKYCQALRDLEYMQECAARHGGDDERDPFYLKTSKTLERNVLAAAGLIPKHINPPGTLPKARDADVPELPGFGRNAENLAQETEKFWIRFSMASLGGLALVVPMLIMANVPGKIASLVTTCVAMVIFAVGITWLTKLAADQMLAATAAYAAFLVVFVGTSLDSSGG